MSLEHELMLPKGDISPDMLLRANINLAMHASGGYWDDPRVGGAKYMRGYQVFTLPDDLLSGAVADVPLETSWEMKFEAKKYHPKYNGIVYKVNQRATTVIPQSDMAPFLRRQLVELNNGSEDSLSSHFEGQNPDNLSESVEFKRSSASAYGVDTDGDVIWYATDEKYWHDEVLLRDTFFSAFPFNTVDPNHYEVNAYERVSSRLNRLGEQQIASEISRVDRDWEEDLAYREISKELMMAGFDAGEHRRRVLSILAAVAYGSISIDQLLADTDK